MIDPLKARLEKLRKSTESAKRRANLYTDIAKMNNGNNTSSLGSLQKAPAPGKKLQKIGFLMLFSFMFNFTLGVNYNTIICCNKNILKRFQRKITFFSIENIGLSTL